jgi:hypothetical protein
MTDLTPEEREKIYLEEKARREAQERLDQETIAAQKAQRQKSTQGCLFLLLGICIFPFLLALMIGAWQLFLPLGIGILIYKVFKLSFKKTLLYSFGLLLLLIIGSAIITATTNHQQQQIQAEQAKQAKIEEQKKLAAEAKITPEQRIQKARNYIKQVKLQTNDFNTQYALLTQARSELDKIKKNTQSQTVKALRSRIQSLTHTLENKQAAATRTEARRKKEAERHASIIIRKEYAKKYESSLLDKNMNVTVTTQGRDATTLRLEYILVSKVWAHQLSKEQELFDTLKSLGFKKFILTDGYDEEWYWTL